MWANIGAASTQLWRTRFPQNDRFLPNWETCEKHLVGKGRYFFGCFFISSMYHNKSIVHDYWIFFIIRCVELVFYLFLLFWSARHARNCEPLLFHSGLVSYLWPGFSAVVHFRTISIILWCKLRRLARVQSIISSNVPRNSNSLW